jgi:hypothetical protein
MVVMVVAAFTVTFTAAGRAAGIVHKARRRTRRGLFGSDFSRIFSLFLCSAIKRLGGMGKHRIGFSRLVGREPTAPFAPTDTHLRSRFLM